MAVGGAAVLEPVFRATGGRKGRLSLQTDPANYRNADRMLSQGLHFAGLAPNIQVKFPATSAGLAGPGAGDRGRREHQRHGQLHGRPGPVAVGEAVERGLRRPRGVGRRRLGHVAGVHHDDRPAG